MLAHVNLVKALDVCQRSRMCIVWVVGSGENILGGVGAVVHQEELDILDVADEEGLVAGGHHEAGLLVGAETNLTSVSKTSS